MSIYPLGGIVKYYLLWIIHAKLFYMQKNYARRPKVQPKVKLASKSPIPNAELWPMRINKYLALKNYATRRDADEIIKQKKVFINGALAVLGDKVKEDDTVEVKYRGKTAPEYAYFAYNKPIGMNTGAEKDEGNNPSQDIISSLPVELKKLKLFPLGRLDKDSHGLIILTNDGRVTDRLLNPKYEHKKEYEVTVREPLRSSFKEKMERGINIEGYVTEPAKVKILKENKFNITLTEGKTHQIRRMASAVFNEVKDLKRIGIMNIRLENLHPGSARPIVGRELEIFLKSLGLI